MTLFSAPMVRRMQRGDTVQYVLPDGASGALRIDGECVVAIDAAGESTPLIGKHWLDAVIVARIHSISDLVDDAY